jgi:hypothetical protein
MRRTLATLLWMFGLPSLAVAQIDVTKLVWSTCGACPQPAEVVAAGATVTVGVAGRPQNGQQNEAYHMAATLLPPAASYTVKFQYNLSTWDSYNAPGTPNPPFNGGTGHWDSFSVSISGAPYWQLPLSDPITTTQLPGLGFLWGGSSYGGNNPAQQSSSTTTITIKGNPNGKNYLNVGLDTATLPDADTNYPSWGTFTIISITPTCTGDITDLTGMPSYYQCGSPYHTPAAGQPGAWWAEVYDPKDNHPHVISAATNAKPTVLSSTNHGLASGASITILNGTGSWATINGAWKITVIDANSFSIPLDTTGFGGVTGSLVWTQDTICRWGCAMTSLSMVLSFYGFPYNPSNLNTTLNSLGGNGYDSNGYVQWSAAAFLSGKTLEYVPGDGSTTQVDADLCNGRPVILGVNGNGHFVVAIGKTGSEYDITDPGHIGVDSLSFYGNTFSSSRRFIPPGSGAFVVYADALVQILVTDPAGRRVGYSNGTIYTEMPGSSYVDEQISSDDQDNPTGTLPLTHVLFIPAPGDGFYQIQITGQQVGSGSVRIYRYNKQNLPLTTQTINTNLVVGQVLTQTTTYSTKLGDVNGDGYVNATDLAIVQASFGRRIGQPGYNPAADINGDGVVDIRDLAYVAHFDPPPGPPPVIPPRQ